MEPKRRDPATGRPLPNGVQYRGPSRYRARVLVGPKRIERTFDTAPAAAEWLDKQRADVRAGTYVDRSELGRVTVGSVVSRFRDQVLIEGGERRGWLNDRGHVPAILNDEISGTTLAALSPADVRRFRDWRIAARMAKATAVKRMNLLASVLQHARSEWDVPLTENVATGRSVKRPRGADVRRTRRLRVPTPAAQRLAAERGEVVLPTEEEVLLEILERSEHPEDAVLVRFALAQATRLGEQLGLRWHDVDLEARTLTLHGRLGRGVKSAEHRRSADPERRALMPDAAAILRSLGPGAPDDLVFGSSYEAQKVRIGRKITRAAERMIGVKRELRYLDDLRFHDLRHEATSRLAKVFKDSKDLMRVTGHMDFKSMRRYYQPDPTELAMIAEELARKASA